MDQHPVPIDLVRQIRSTYMEMPGVRLRPHFAQRHWGVSSPVCRAAFRVLVDTGFLFRTRDGAYGRREPGSWTASPTPIREAPWDCRWAEPRSTLSSVWLAGCRTQWTCLRDGGPESLAGDDCVNCPRWEPLLVSRPVQEARS